MAKLTIEDISRILTDKNGLSREAAATFAREMFSVVQDAVERDKLVKVKGLGAFKVVDVEARESINVNTGERVLIEGHGKISFTPDTTMKELVNKPFSQFETVVLNDGVTFDDIATPDEVEEESNDEEQQKQEIQPQEQQQEQQEQPQEPQEPQENEQERPQEPQQAPQENEQEQPQEPAESSNNRAIEQSSNRAIEQSNARTIEQSDNRPLEASSPIEASIETSPDEPSIETSPDESPAETSDTAKWIVASVISLVLIVLAACGGYIYGLNKGRAEADSLIAARQDTKPQAPQSKDSLLAALHPEEPVVLDSAKSQSAKDAANVTSKAETKISQKGVTAKDTPKAEQKTKAEQKAKLEQKTMANQKPEAKTEQKPKAEPSAKYEQMDARVRTGAYRIVGVDRTVTVKKGETLKRISKTYLGEGMECYVEVLNGLSGNGELKEGSKLKIPKLELKKKSK